MSGCRSVHFLHIGKTGGTAIKHVLEQQRSARRFTLVLHAHETRLRDIPERDCVFFFLRNPLARFVSGFYSRQRQGQPRYLSPWSAQEAKAFQRFDTPNRLAETLSSEDSEQRASAVEAMTSIGHVRTHYAYWFENEAYFRSRLRDIFFIGFQETLDTDFDQLRLKLGLDRSLRLPTDAVQAHRNPGSLDTSLNEAAIKNLREWYAADLAFVETCRGLAESINPQYVR